MAYKSLVENPKSMFSMQSIDEDDMCTRTESAANATLPRSNNFNDDTPLEHVPQSNKAATLSKLLKMSKDCEPSTSSSSPLKILREKSLAIGKPRLKILPSVGSESINSTTFLLDHDGENPCETPSYLKSAGGNFNLEAREMMHSCNEQLTSSKTVVDDDSNILPLPPKPKAASFALPQKRHIRKHPLIIPVNGIQRTLDKINQTTPVEEKQYEFQVPSDDAPPVPQLSESTTVQQDDDDDDDDVFEDLKKDTRILQEIEENVNSHYGKLQSAEKVFARDFIENNFPDTPAMSSDAFKRSSFVDVNGQRTYENLEAFQRRFSLDEEDTASLHFESILENDENVAKVTTTSEDLVDGFCPFERASSCSNVASTSTAKDDEMKKPAATRPLSIEVKKLEFSQKFPKYKMPRNELASNALFNKIKASVENAAKYGDDEECEVELDVESVDCDLKRSINHVSCEDLLDFSEMKPKGRERGSESDEVRIMVKMFGTKVSFC